MPNIFMWSIVELDLEVCVVSDTAIHSKDIVILLLEGVYGSECRYEWLKWVPQYNFGYVMEYGTKD